MKGLYSVLAVATALAIYVCGPTGVATAQATTGGTPKQVAMAEVAGQEITVRQFMQFISQDGRLVQQSVTQSGKTRVLREYITLTLFGKEMQARGLLPRDEPVPNFTSKEYQEGLRRLRAEHFPLPPKPSEGVALAFYEKHKERFGLPKLARVTQIQLRVPEDADAKTRAKVRTEAESLLKRIEQGESFGALAAEYTENPRAKVSNGDLGFLPVNEDQWLKNALEGLEVGDHTGVLESPVGFEILKLTAIREPMITPFPNVRKRVIQLYRMQKQREKRYAYAGELADKYGVNIKMKGLEAARP